MVQQGAYFNILDWLDGQDRVDPSAFLQRLRADYATGPITYVDGTITSGRLHLHALHHSSVREARQIGRRLRERRVVDQLETVLVALEPVPVDLTRLHVPDPDTKHAAGTDILPAAGYPLLSQPARRACILVQSQGDADFWRDWRRQHDRDILSLAGRFHARISQTSGKNGQQRQLRDVALTRRERETLAWIASGKSYWEAAIILGISERTIRYFMANARRKLDVVNNAQAVAEAVWRGLIPRLADTLNP